MSTTPIPVTTKYGYIGPPFNFLGHFCQSQFTPFSAWVNARTGKLPSVQQFYQIRASQLRKTAGVLEQFYTATNDEKLSPTFKKGTWQAVSGWTSYKYRDDHLPMVSMAGIKDYLKEQFNRQDEAVFQMNHIRNLIEKTEDKAQKANEAPTKIKTLLTEIQTYFNKPEYQAVLVKDTTDLYQNQPRFRWHQFDAPSQWEGEMNTRQLTPGGSIIPANNQS